MNKFAERINFLVDRYDGTLTQYARRIDVSINQLYAYRAGNAEANFDVLLKISDVENVSLDWLLGSNYQHDKNYTNDEISMLKDFGSLNKDGKRQVREHMNYICSKPEFRRNETTA